MKKPVVNNVSYFLIIKSKAMNTNMNDPGNGGCCGGLGDWGCC